MSPPRTISTYFCSFTWCLTMYSQLFGILSQTLKSSTSPNTLFRHTIAVCALLLCLFLSGFSSAAEAPASPLRDPALASAVNSLNSSLGSLISAYYRELRAAKSQAINNADPDEVARINQALSGQPVREFQTAGAQRARSKLDKGLLEISGKFQSSATSGVVVLLKQERVKEAQELKRIIEYVAYNSPAAQGQEASGNVQFEPLEYVLARCLPDGGEKIFGRDLRNNDIAAPLSGGNTETDKAQSAGVSAEKENQSPERKHYRLKVFAEKDWQVYPLEIKAGDRVSLTAAGSWQPDEDLPAGGADTYAYSYKIGGGEAVRAGSGAEFVAGSGGRLLLRISNRDWIVESGAKPSGALEITVTIEHTGAEGR